MGGTFGGNKAGGGGGVASVEAGAKLLVGGGEYLQNEAKDTGGAFSVAEDGDMEVRRQYASHRTGEHWAGDQ